MNKFIFFQNCISPHQMPYIEELSKRDDVEHVWVVAPRLAYSERSAMGWPETWTTSSEKLSVIINPDDGEVLKLFGNEGCLCTFLGISAFPEIKHWLLLSLPFNVKRGIITEPPYTFDKPLWLHKIRFALKDWRYVKYFDYVFAIGEDCAEYYKLWSKRWKVVPFMYCTEDVDLTAEIRRNTQKIITERELRICFVGSLDRRKNVRELMEAMTQIKDKRLSVTIVGDGPERNSLEAMAKQLGDNISVDFLGALPMEETQKVIASNDVLVLPSLHDGWGAVINEAMTLGTLPVCSDRCGAKYLIRISGFGRVYKSGVPDELAEAIRGIDAEEVRAMRKDLVLWSKGNISPQAVAERFLTEQTAEIRRK